METIQFSLKEIIFCLAFENGKDACDAMLVCKEWRKEITEMNNLWKKLYMKRWPLQNKDMKLKNWYV